MDIQDVINYINETPHNTNPAVLKGMVEAIVESSESGGGDGGDVTLATIKFINADTSTMYVVTNLTEIVDTGDFEILSAMPGFEVQDEEEVIIPLYKGKYGIHPSSLQYVDQSFFPQLTGGVTMDMENGFFVVTGDGTITCKGTHSE